MKPRITILTLGVDDLERSLKLSNRHKIHFGADTQVIFKTLMATSGKLLGILK
jgi:hypothetical protein